MSTQTNNNIIPILIPVFVGIFIYYYKPNYIMKTSPLKTSEIDINKFLILTFFISLIFWIVYFMAGNCQCNNKSTYFNE